MQIKKGITFFIDYFLGSKIRQKNLDVSQEKWCCIFMIGQGCF